MRAAAVAIVLLGLAACAVLPPAGTVTTDGRVRVVGYNDMDEMLAALGAGYARRHPGVRFDFDLKSTRSAPAALIEGRSAFAPMGAELEPEDLERYRQRYGTAPIEIRIAHDSLDPVALSSPTGVFVHRDNPLDSVTMGELARAFGADGLSENRTWGELGAAGSWRTRPVHLIGLAPDTAIAKRTARVLHLPRGYAPRLRAFRQSREAAAAAASDPYSLTLANLNHARPELRPLNLIVDGLTRAPNRATIASGRYPLDRQLLVYVPRGSNGSASRFAVEFVRFALSEEGQQIIGGGSRGYIPLSPAERKAELKKLN